MEKLGVQNIEIVSTCIQQIYKICTLAEFPRRVIAVLKNLIGAEESFFCSLTTHKLTMTGEMLF
jgi:hypothetical protein